MPPTLTIKVRAAVDYVVTGVAFWSAVVASHVESWGRRLDMLTRPAPRTRNGSERRRNPRTCTLCGGPMRPDGRPKEVLAWFRCGRCHQSQQGVPLSGI